MNCSQNACDCGPQGGPGASQRSASPVLSPRCDILDHGAEYILHADLPGCAADSVTVTFEEGVLTISGTSPARSPSGTRLLRREHAQGDFRREFRLGEDVDVDRIMADFAQGVLTVRLPKAQDAAPRKIEVRRG